MAAKTSMFSKKNLEGVVTDGYKPNNPFIGKCLRTKKITGDDAPEEIWHIVINTDGKFPYAEGQYVEVIRDGTDKKEFTFFSIASSARGDDGDSKTVSLCVKRVFHTDDQGQKEPEIISNFLCDLRRDDEVKLAGPSGDDFLMPKDHSAPIIMLATETGIAPFRSFCRKMFIDQHDDYKFNGEAWLFFAAPTNSSLLYHKEFKEMKNSHKEFHYDPEVGAETNIPTGLANCCKLQLWESIMKRNASVYMSGKEDMEKAIDEYMTELASKHDEIWLEWKPRLTREGRWNVRVFK